MIKPPVIQTTSQLRCQAFSLIEFMVAFALASGLILALLGFQFHTSDTQAQVGNRVQEMSSDRLLMNAITMQIQRAAAFPQLGLSVQGEAERITFIVPTIPGGDAWRVQQLTEKPTTPQQDLRIVTWQLQRSEDEDGVEQIDGVSYYEEKILIPLIDEEVAAEGESTDSDEDVDTGGEAWLVSYYVQFVHFEYWDGGTWQPEWIDPELPIAVRVRFGKEPLPEGTEPTEYPFETKERTVLLQGASRTLPGGGILPGIGGGL